MTCGEEWRGSRTSYRRGKFATKVLLERRSHGQPQVETEQAKPVEVEATTRTEPGTRGEATRKPGRSDESGPEETSASTSTPPSTATPALATVTVLIDPESGLLAKPDCPVRSRMTYPSGSQPGAYCNLNHEPPPKESKIKVITEKILPQRRKGAKAQKKTQRRT